MDRIIRNPIIGIGFFIVLIFLWTAIHRKIYVNYHEPGPMDGVHFGFCDFHNGIYWPGRALQDRISPYGEIYSREYPVPRSTPFYLPSTFLWHTGFVWSDLRFSEQLYFGFMLLLIFILSLIALRVSGVPYAPGWSALFMTLVTTSRAGYGTLFSGYFTFELALASLLAIHWGHRQVWGGLMLAIAASKPTYAIPLGLILIARGNWKTVLYGSAIAAIASIAVYLWLLPGKPWDFLVSDIQYGQVQHMADWAEVPVNSWTRVDLVAIISKWLQADPGELQQLAIFLVAAGIPIWLLSRLQRFDPSPPIRNLSLLLSLLTMNALFYRHYYDLVVLCVPIFTLIFGTKEFRPPFSERARWAIAGLLLIALFNYGSTMSFFGKFNIDRGTWAYLWLTSLSGVALAGAFAIVLFEVTRLVKSHKTTPVATH